MDAIIAVKTDVEQIDPAGSGFLVALVDATIAVKNDVEQTDPAGSGFLGGLGGCNHCCED